jgi:hypothetical protein
LRIFRSYGSNGARKRLCICDRFGEDGGQFVAGDEKFPLELPTLLDLNQISHLRIIIGKQLLTVDAALSELRSALRVLEAVVAKQLSPGNPLAGIQALWALQQTVTEQDPHARESKKARELIEMLEKWQQGGGGPVGQS